MKTCKLPGRLQIALALSAILSCVALPARALDVGVAAGAGTLGAGLSVTLGISERFNARLGFGNFSVDDDFEESGVEYEAELTLGGTYALLDWHPGKGTFRVSAGLIANNNELTGDARLSDDEDVEIGDDTYSADEIGSLEATVDFDDLAPYVGIGWGNAADGNRGLGFSFDLGLMFQGEANVDLDASDGTLVDNAVFRDDLAREEDNLEEDLDEFVNLDVYPVVAFGISFTF